MRSVSKASLINKKLRKGYTTGTCAAAAAKAVVEMLITGKNVTRVEVSLPRGGSAFFNPVEQRLGKDETSCGVIKDAGDDPDVTDGMVIYARTRLIESEIGEIKILAGDGIGTVTKPGLSVPIGQPAINPIPRQMIEENVRNILPKGLGVEITIFAPEGREKAKQTLNKKLGVVGGISILGTTGIVRPMSLDGLKRSLLPQVDIAIALGHKTIVLVPGNMGAKIAQEKLNFSEDAIVQMSNFVGDMLDYCMDKEIEKILILGHIGKIAKIAAGYFDTHSSKTDSPIEILKRLVRKATRDTTPVMFMLKVNTADEAAVGLSKLKYSQVLNKIAKEASMQAMEYVSNRIYIGTAVTVLTGDIVGIDENAKKIMGDGIW